jgi:endonuclease/exonuclease/phosphatase (EEP) superfamily protein YafD
MNVVVLILAGLLALASLAPLVRHDAWWIRSFDFPRLQIFGLGVVVLGAYLFVWDVETWVGGITLGLLAAALLLQAYRILPFTPLWPKQVTSAPPDTRAPDLSLMVANVLMSNRQAGRLVEIVRDRAPDLVLTLEPDDWWERELRVLEDDYPYTLKAPLDNRYGMLLHSRLELVEPEIKHLISDEFPSMHLRVRLDSGDLVWLHALHPEPPSPTEADESTRRDAELLIVGDHIKDRDEPTIVAGDLNDVAWSYTTTLFQKVSGLLDPRKGRGMFNTFHAEHRLLRWPLDHVFHSDHFTLAEMARLPAFGSDHFPVYARLVLEAGAQARQDEVEADADDVEQAEEKIAAVNQQDEM